MASGGTLSNQMPYAARMTGLTFDQMLFLLPAKTHIPHLKMPQLWTS